MFREKSIQRRLWKGMAAETLVTGTRQGIYRYNIICIYTRISSDPLISNESLQKFSEQNKKKLVIDLLALFEKESTYCRELWMQIV